MGSERLPGKVLLPVLGKPLLAYELERLRRAKEISKIVVATTTDSQDDAIEKFCKNFDVACFRGDEAHVLKRYYDCAEKFSADIVVRVTEDCPLIKPGVVDRLIETAIEEDLDYVSNTLERTFPRGLDCEVFKFSVLKTAYLEATDPYEIEHVTAFLYRRPESFELANLPCKENLSAHRWTVDTKEDFELIRRILESLYPKTTEFGLRDILRLLKKHPDWMKLNASVSQKAG